MITEQDLLSAIAECQGKRNPDANTCIKLAAFYTIKNELFGNSEQLEQMPTYSYAPAPDQKQEDKVTIDSDTEFARVIDGREQKEIMPVLDELMTTLQAIQPRLYNAVMEKLYR